MIVFNNRQPKHPIIRSHQILTTLLLLAFVCPSFAATNYQVELYVFKQPNRLSNQEFWPASSDIVLDIPNNATTLKSGSSQQPAPFQKLDDSWFNTPEIKQELSKGGFQLLYRAAWQQEIGSKKNPDTIFIQGGRKKGAIYELEGILKLYKERYLHAEVHLLSGDLSLLTESANNPPVYLFELKENRRLQSNQLHYLDHPKLGVLLKIFKL